MSALGAERILLMVGDDVFQAGVAEISASTPKLEMLTLTPDPALISHVAGNGKTLLIGAAGVGSQSGGLMSDGIYVIDGETLSTVVGPSRRLLAPSLSPDGAIAAVNAFGGISVRESTERPWRHLDVLRGRNLTTVAWGATGNLLTVIRPGGPSALLMKFRQNGQVRRLGSAYCAAMIVAAPNGRFLATNPPNSAGQVKCTSGRVIDLADQSTIRIPRAWHPLAWSKDSNSLLVSRGSYLGVWNAKTGVTHRVDIGVQTWMAAPKYSDD